MTHIRNLISLNNNVRRPDKIKVATVIFNILDPVLLNNKKFADTVLDKLLEFVQDNRALNDKEFLNSIRTAEKKLVGVYGDRLDAF